MEVPGVGMPAWVECFNCEDMWCNLHATHVSECDCPAIDDWLHDPYSKSCIGVSFPVGEAPVMQRVGPQLYAADDESDIPWMKERFS